MNAITKWNPLRDLEDFQNRFFGALYPNMRQRNADQGDNRGSITEWAPLADVVEDEDAYRITLELPQVAKEDVKVTVENGILTVTGERKFEKETEGRKYHRVERAYGCFSRSFSLPQDGDASKVEAKFSDGVLSLSIAKNEAARPKQIEVKVE